MRNLKKRFFVVVYFTCQVFTPDSRTDGFKQYNLSFVDYIDGNCSNSNSSSGQYACFSREKDEHIECKLRNKLFS